MARLPFESQSGSWNITVALDLTIIDLFFILLMLVAAIRGAVRGFVAEVGSMAALVLGIGGGLFFAGKLGQVLAGLMGESVWNQIIAFLALFMLIYLLVKLLEKMLHGLFDKLNLNRLDRVLGFFLGIAEGILLVGLILIVLAWQPFFDLTDVLSSSLFFRVLFPLLPSTRIFSGSEALFNNV